MSTKWSITGSLLFLKCCKLLYFTLKMLSLFPCKKKPTYISPSTAVLRNRAFLFGSGSWLIKIQSQILLWVSPPHVIVPYWYKQKFPHDSQSLKDRIYISALLQ